MTQHILTDIMGTTSPNSFVKTLMVDFKDNGAAVIAKGSPEILRIVDEIKEETGLETGEQVVQYALDQVSQRNLDPRYLALNGATNVDGYQTGRITGEVFDDVPEAFRAWKENGKGVFVYSNGSEASQRELFRTVPQDDLTPSIDGFFDTAKVGSKYEADSYKRISDKIQSEPAKIIFLSDVGQELDAAHKAGLEVTLVMRPGNKPVENAGQYRQIQSFKELTF